MAKTTQACMTMNNLDLLSQDDVTKYREKGEYGGHCTLAIYDQKRNIIDFQAVRQVSYPSTVIVGMSDNDHLVASINELGRELINMAFHSSGLRKEKVADHCNIVRHPEKPSTSRRPHRPATFPTIA